MSKKNLIIAAALVVTFGVGFFSGQEYTKYVLRNKIDEALEEFEKEFTAGIAEAFDPDSSYIDNEYTEDETIEEVEIVEVSVGEVAEFATVNVKVNSAEFTNEVSNEFDTFTAQPGTKILVVDYSLENTTKQGLSWEPLSVIDDQDREFTPSLDASQSIENYIYYDELKPNIVLTGKTAYEIPDNVESAWLFGGKKDSNVQYKMNLPL